MSQLLAIHACFIFFPTIWHRTRFQSLRFHKTNGIYSPSSVTFSAGDGIILQSAFEVDQSAVFVARIEGCLNN